MDKQELISKILENMYYDENIRSGIWKCKDDTYQEMFHQAHGDMLPDDHRYQMIHDILEGMHEDPDVDGMEICDSIVPCYTYDLMSWLSSRNDRYAYVDEAIEQYGKGESIINDISAGYLLECMEVFDLINEWIDEHLDDEEEDEVFEELETTDGYGDDDE